MGLSSEGEAIGRRLRPPPDLSTRETLLAWGKILSRAGHGFLRHEVPSAAAAITFYALLSFFPAVGAFVSLYGLIANVETASEHLSILSGILPAEALRFVGNEMVRAA
jgi:membrane protein